MFDFKVDCHVVILLYQFYPIKFYVIIGFSMGGPGGATFTTNGTGGFGNLGSGRGFPRLLSLLSEDSCVIRFLSIPGRPVGVLEK